MHKTGFVVGKFLPCHTGHHYLIDTALEQCEKLMVAVVDDPTIDTIPVELRQDWLQDRHPTSKVIVIKQLQGKDNDSKAWADYTREIFYGDTPDVVFTSEKYGETWAQELGCAHVQVDLDRMTIPCSGTAVREDPYKMWDFLCPPAKAYFTKRVCLVGGESVGKTTMAARLAEHYNTVWCPEYGRYYVELNGVKQDDGNIWSEIFVHQPEWEEFAAEGANKLLIVDTDLITTSVWYERWVGDRHGMWNMLRDFGWQWAKDKYDLYLFLDDNVPWINDGTRSEGDPQVREWFTDKLFEGIWETEVPMLMIDDKDYDARLSRAIQAIDYLVLKNG